mgnify:CR=1 FL=1
MVLDQNPRLIRGNELMVILERIKNSYSYGGIREVVRKAFFLAVYTIVGRFTSFIVKNSKIEYGLNNSERKDHIVVSLTSFPKRFPYLGMCLKSLVIQKVKPDKIIVYLGSDSTPDMLTEEMKFYQNYGVEYRFDKTMNIMPHKKYFYAMQEFENSIVVTADDDVIYPRNWLKSLYDSYKHNPNAVSARRVHQIKFDGQGRVIPYDKWKDQCRNIRKPSKQLIATGNSGVLYPPKCLHIEAFDKDAITNLCLRSDDLWLKCMEIKNDTPVVWVKNWQVKPASIDSENNSRLQDENIFTGKNDFVLRVIMEYCSITDSDFM